MTMYMIHTSIRIMYNKYLQHYIWSILNNRIMLRPMAQCKAVVSRLLTHWIYCSLDLSHRNNTHHKTCDRWYWPNTHRYHLHVERPSALAETRFGGPGITHRKRAPITTFPITFLNTFKREQLHCVTWNVIAGKKIFKWCLKQFITWI